MLFIWFDFGFGFNFLRCGLSKCPVPIAFFFLSTFSPGSRLFIESLMIDNDSISDFLALFFGVGSGGVFFFLLAMLNWVTSYVFLFSFPFFRRCVLSISCC